MPVPNSPHTSSYSPQDAGRRARLIMELRGLGITNTRILKAMEKLPRELFVHKGFEGMAWQDMALPIEEGEMLPEPYMTALMSEQLELAPEHKVLLVGTGSGYHTALLSLLCRRVYTVEIRKSLLISAEERFGRLNLANIATRHADGLSGWDAHTPFDRIVVTGAVPQIPQSLVAQLVPDGGIMIVPVGTSRFEQYLTHVTRTQQSFHSWRAAASRFMNLHFRLC